MINKDSSTQDEPKPVQETTQTNEQNTEHKAEISAPLPVINSLSTQAEEPKPDESYDETDRKQDEAIDSLAEQTKWIVQQTGWMAKQTKWVRAQTLGSFFLGLVTLGVLVYHGIIMSRQSQAARDQTDIMRGQLESMNSSSQQTQDLIEATRGTANASQRVAEQNKELVKHAGEQANASTTQAKAALAQAETAKQSTGFAASAARAAEQSVQVAKESIRIGERPSVGVTGLHLDELTADKIAHAIIAFQNTGRAPARHVTSMVTMDIRANDYPEPRFSNVTIGIVSRGSIAINAQRFAHAFSLYGLSVDVINDIKQHKKWLFVYGLLEYDNGRGDKYFTQYCGRYNPDYYSGTGTFEDCPIFNDSN